MSDSELSRDERQRLSYLRQRLAGSRSVLLDKKLPLHARLERAYVEGFSATLTDWFPDRDARAREEWEAIREEFVRIGRINVTLAIMSEPELEVLERRIRAFLDDYDA